MWQNSTYMILEGLGNPWDQLGHIHSLSTSLLRETNPDCGIPSVALFPSFTWLSCLLFAIGSVICFFSRRFIVNRCFKFEMLLFIFVFMFLLLSNSTMSSWVSWWHISSRRYARFVRALPLLGRAALQDFERSRRPNTDDLVRKVVLSPQVTPLYLLGRHHRLGIRSVFRYYGSHLGYPPSLDILLQLVGRGSRAFM